MQTMFIVRLLGAERDVLAWTKIPAETRGDGGLWAMQDFVAEADQDGVGTAMNFHWPDVHVYTSVPLPQPVPVHAGKVLTVSLKLAPMLQLQSEPLPLPGVTVKTSVEIGIRAAHR